MRKLLPLFLILGVLALLVAPVAAQDESVGNVVIDATFGDVTNLNVLTSSDADSTKLTNQMYPGLVGVNPETATIEPGAPGGLATSWDISSDGLVYTFHLRDDYQWSDGQPLTAHDFQATWDAIASGLVNTSYVSIMDTISGMKALDDTTLEVTFKAPSCEALVNAAVPPMPAHVFNGDWAKYSAETFTTPGTMPSVGPYKLGSYVSQQQIGLVPVTETKWPDAPTNNEGYILKILGSQTVGVEQLFAGQIDVLGSVPVDRRSDALAAQEKGELEVYQYNPGNAWDYLAWNTADPKNPQPALDENGNRIEQTPHPLFGDVRVRQALAQAVDVNAIIQGAVFGYGTPMQGGWSKGTWSYDESVPFYKLDQVAAGKLLDEAGFVDDDNDPSTPRVANDKALYAPPGTKLEFTLYTNEGNTRRTAIGTIVQDQLSKIGVKADFQTLEFGVLLDLMDQQTFDAIILGWQNGYPDTPGRGTFQLWSSTSDTIGGSNMTSYANPEIDALMQQADTLPGCDQAERAKIFGQIQQILHRDTPYLFLYSQEGMYAWNPRVEGVSPYPAALYWNVNEWKVSR